MDIIKASGLMGIRSSRKIRSWQQFTKFERSRGCGLLRCLGNFEDPILVTGCQRSGTTLVARLLRLGKGMIDFQAGKDDELDGALILSGRVPPPQAGRYCFQTTYVNNCFHEYFDHAVHYKIIWLLREPLSVVWSMVYHWKRYALNDLFRSCGFEFLDKKLKKHYQYFGAFGIPGLTKACLSYIGKTNQLFTILERLGHSAIKVVEYDDLVMRKHEVLPQLFEFVEVPYIAKYADRIHINSTSRQKLLSQREKEYIETHCLPIYQKAQDLIIKC